MPSHSVNDFQWLRTGDEAFAAAARLIDTARTRVDLEVYIFSSDSLGAMFRDRLVRACSRGVRVRVLIDAFGSVMLANSFWDPLLQAGGEMRWFNPITFRRFQIRDHRKLLVCDGQLALVGGFNVGPEWQGDGVTRGWHDLGLQISGPLAGELQTSFEQMFERANFRHKRFLHRNRGSGETFEPSPDSLLLLSGPGHQRRNIAHALRQDLGQARTVDIIAAYFLPPRKLRRKLIGVARRGGSVRLILPGRSDIPLMQLATRSLYQRLLDAGIEIYEYQPQVLHAKLVLIDEIVYVGSSNLDVRSLNINYELMVRLPDSGIAAAAREIVARDLGHCRRIEPETWSRSRTFWSKLKERWAYVLFAKIDPYVARRQLELMP